MFKSNADRCSDNCVDEIFGSKEEEEKRGRREREKNILQTLTNAIYFRRIYERKLENSLCALSLSFVYLSTVVL